MDGIQSGTPAAYGHACTNCARAKSRCIVRDRGLACERCHRLNKECSPSSSVRKRGVKKAQSESRRHQLEEKLDGLVSLLQAQSAPKTTSTNNAVPTPPFSYHSHQDVFHGGEEGLWDDLTQKDLNTFRTSYLPRLPFMHLAVSATTQQLQSENPLLCLAIRAICERSLPRQTELGAGFRRVLARKTVISDERSMDLLLSVIAVATWPLPFGHGKEFMTMLSNIGKMIICDLRLDRPATHPVRCPRIGPEPFEHKGVRTNDGRRAILAFFCLHSMVINCMGYEVLKWSPQLDEACSKLEEDNETSGDRKLVAMARIARVAFDAAKIVRRASEDLEFARHITFQISALKSSLEHVKRTLAPEELQNEAVLSCLYNAEVSVHEAIIHQPPSSSIQEPPDLRRLDHLTACLQACKTSMEHYLAIHPSHQTTSIMLTLPYTLVVLYRLSVLNDPLWGRTTVRTTANVVTYLEKAALNMEEANAALCAETGEDSVFVKGMETLRSSIPRFRTALERSGLDDTFEAQVSATGMSTNEAFDFSTIDFLDDLWYSDIFGS